MKMSQQIQMLEGTVGMCELGLKQAKTQLKLFKKTSQPQFHQTRFGHTVFSFAAKMFQPFVTMQQEFNTIANNPVQYRIEEFEKNLADVFATSKDMLAINNKWYHRYIIAKLSKLLLEGKYLAGEHPENEQLAHDVELVSTELKRLINLKPPAQEVLEMKK